MSGLLDIHVLEETTLRVSTLTKSIDKQVDYVQELTNEAQSAVRASGSRAPSNLGQLRQNAEAVLLLYEVVEDASKRIADLEEPIEQGVEAVGWEEYLAIVDQAQKLCSDVSSQHELQRFAQLAENAADLYEKGQVHATRYFRKLAKHVIKPQDEKGLPESSELASPAEISLHDLNTLAKLLDGMAPFPEAEKGADDTVQQLLAAYITGSFKTVLSRQPPPSVAEFKDYSSRLRVNLVPVAEVLYASSVKKQKQTMKSVDDVLQRETRPATEKLGTKRPNLALNTQLAARQGPMSAQPLASNNPMPITPGPKSAGAYPSIEARRGPQITTSSPSPSARAAQGTPPLPSGPVPVTPTATFSASSTPVAPAVGTPYQPTTKRASYGSSQGSPYGSANSAQTGVSTWSSIELLESKRLGTEYPPDEVARAKREGLAVVMQVFVDISQQCRKSPITSEHGVSGASIQFLKTLQIAARNAAGVDVVLSELPTRGYLTKPPPDWANLNRVITPEARANPVSLYFADCIDCLYANLHQVAQEQLKDPTRVGLFLLCNLAAVERFITDSNTESIKSLKGRPSPMMRSLGEVALNRFEKDLEAAMKLHLADWEVLAHELLDSTLTAAAPNTKLTGKDREVVKEKFRVFNSKFEQLVERQRRFPVQDMMLRQLISAEVRQLVFVLYDRFYKKHKGGDFTKNIGKYLKYTPQDVDSMIQFR